MDDYWTTPEPQPVCEPLDPRNNFPPHLCPSEKQKARFDNSKKEE